MKIGELAKKARCPAVTIRFYEKMGLIPNSVRNSSNHRVYGEEDGERLRFILHCRNHKIPLQHIRQLLAMRDGTAQADGVDAVSLLNEHIENLKSQRDSLGRLIAALQAILHDLSGVPEDNMEVLDILGSPCPHCPDYEEQVQKGRRIDNRALRLAAPEKR